MSLAHAHSPAQAVATDRAGVVARTMKDRLAGTAMALAFTSGLLVAVAITADDVPATAHLATERIWQTVSSLVCGSHMDAVSLVGPSCGMTAP